jgi:dipeptidase E
VSEEPQENRRIVAMGGGGFSATPSDPALDAYVLEVARAAEPRICLLPTAGGDAEEQIRRFHRAYRDLPCHPSHLSLFRLGNEGGDPRAKLLSQDVIYVGGGSMLNLIAIWRAHRLDEVLREAWERGIVLCGISAGSMCWFERGVTKSHGAPAIADGLGFLPGSDSVHYRSEPERRPHFLAAVGSGALPPGYGVDDGVGLLWHGTELVEAVSARPDGGAWRVTPDGSGGATEVRVDVRRLPTPAAPRVSLAIEELRESRRFRAAAR